MAALTTSGLHPASAQNTATGQFENQADVGSPSNPGSAQFNDQDQEYIVNGSGVNMWSTRDEFHFVWKRMKGDFILQARAGFAGKGVDAHRKLGFIARPGLDPDVPYADAAVHGNGLASLQFRRAQGRETEQVQLPVQSPDVIQFQRRGDTFIFSAAKFGEPFVSNSVSGLGLGDELYVGLFVCAHHSNVVEHAFFRDVRIIRPVKEGFAPYRDYIGSQLEILDVAAGRRKVIYSSARPFEAPNWTPDGKALIFNTSGTDASYRGRLARFDLSTKQPTTIDTGFAIHNNNDHVLSFDGSMIGVSHHSADHAGQSAVYTLPVGGGEPRLITPNAPSYLHGWSPDAKWLVYTGGRGGVYNIYKIPSKGGDEIQLTHSAGLSDGPEFTPDGKYIYFNSTRSGLMQIWRMKPDGADQEQITSDEFNNWFPHISPDGKSIAFLSYTKEVAPNDHPYYKQVYLRVMPFGGGTPRVVAYIYGGQGTMNVPSWAPDSSRLAFVSNSDIP